MTKWIPTENCRALPYLNIFNVAKSRSVPSPFNYFRRSSAFLLVFSRSLLQSSSIRRSSKPHTLFLRCGLATEDVKPLPESNTVRTSEHPAHIKVSPPPPRQSSWRNFLQLLGRTTLIGIVVGAGGFYYITQREKHPGPQLPFDPEKKTVVVLGSGWGATSLLSTIDTTDYNVVCDFRAFLYYMLSHSHPSRSLSVPKTSFYSRLYYQV